MNKKKIKYPDGGKLPSYTTGTPEYEAYLAKKKQYEENKVKHDALIPLGFKNQIIADKAMNQNLNTQFGFTEENSPSGWYRYDSPEKIEDSGFGKYIYNTDERGASDSGTRYSYLPYYDSPGEAEIIKSEADIATEKAIADKEAFAKQYQGYITNNVPIQKDDGSWTMSQEAIPLPVGQEAPTSGTFHTDLPANANLLYSDTVSFASGGTLDVGTMSTLMNSIPTNNNQYLEPIQGEQGYEGIKTAVGNAIPIAGLIKKGAEIGQSLTTNLFQDKEKGATISEGFWDPFKSQTRLMQNNDATSLEKALGFLPFTSGFINDKVNNRVEGEQNQQDWLRSKSDNSQRNLFPDGGKMNLPISYGNITIDADPNVAPVEFNSPFYSTPKDFDAMSNYVGTPIGKNPSDNQFNMIKQILPVHQTPKDNLYQVFSGGDKQKQMDNFYNQQNQIWENNQKSFGGNINKYPDGGFVEYNGPTHADGGVPIDQNGQPTAPQMAQAEVEGGETLHDDGIDKYIFSDRLVVEPKSKTTFADMSKKINNKYKGDNLDKFQKEARELELNRLKQEQEMFKSTIAGNQTEQPVMAKGGYIPKYPDGGIIPYSPELLNEMQYGNIERLPMNSIQGISTNYNSDLPINLLPISRLQNNQTKIIPTSPISELPLNIQMQYGNVTKLPINNINSITNPHFINSINGNNSGLQTIPEANFDDFTLDAPIEYKSYLEDIKASSNNKQDKTSQEDILPQDKINPLGFVASNIGNAYDLYNANKPAKENKFAKVSQEGINLESQRRELEKQAALSKDINRENVRSLATSSGQALGNQIVANALINSNLSSGLSQSFLNEATTNTGIRNQENLANTEIRNQEIIADQMDKAKRESTTSQALHSTGMNTQSYLRDLKSADVGNENNKMWFDAINNSSKYFVIGTDANGNKVFQAKDGSNKIITKPKND